MVKPTTFVSDIHSVISNILFKVKSATNKTFIRVHHNTHINNYTKNSIIVEFIIFSRGT